MALGSQLQVLTQPTQDAGALRAAVDSVQPGDSRASYGELARAVRSLADTRARRRSSCIFSATCRNRRCPRSFSELALPANVTLVLHPVAKDAVPNWTVESVNAPGQVWDPKKARVQAVIAGFGTPAATRTVSLVVNGKTAATQNRGGARRRTRHRRIPVARRAVRLHPLRSAHRFGGCVSRRRREPVCRGAVRSAPRAFCVRRRRLAFAALFPLRAGLGRGSRRSRWMRSAPEQAANQQLSKYAFVVLSDLISVPASVRKRSAAIRAGGGSVWIAEGTSAAHSTRIPVFGGNVLESHDYSRTGDRYLNVGDADPSHPSVEKADRWSGVKFYFAVRVDPGDARVVAHLTDRTPLLLEKKIGEGSVLLFASGLDNLTNDFPLHPVFVPFVEQTALYLSGTERRSGSRWSIRFSNCAAPKEQSVGVEVIDPEGHRPLSLKEAASAQTFQLTQRRILPAATGQRPP